MRVILAVVLQACRNPRPRLIARLRRFFDFAGHGMDQLRRPDLRVDRGRPLLSRRSHSCWTSSPSGLLPET